MDQERKLIRDIQRHGSRSAANALISNYYDEIYVFSYRQIGNKEDAMDMTQEIFIAALRSIQNYDSRKAGFRTWLYKIASNKVIDARRQFRPEIVPIENREVPDTEDYASSVSNKVLLGQIECYVSALDPMTQSIFRLHLYADKPFPEISTILGQPEAMIKARYYRLMSRLRKEFGNHDGT